MALVDVQVALKQDDADIDRDVANWVAVLRYRLKEVK